MIGAGGEKASRYDLRVIPVMQRMAALLVGFLISVLAVAHDEDYDLPSTQDHVEFKRLSGGYISAYERFSFSSYHLPALQPELTGDARQYTQRETSGLLTRIFYRYEHVHEAKGLLQALGKQLKAQRFTHIRQSNNDASNHLAANAWPLRTFRQQLQPQIQNGDEPDIDRDHPEGNAESGTGAAVIDGLIIAEKGRGDSVIYLVGSLFPLSGHHAVETGHHHVTEASNGANEEIANKHFTHSQVGVLIDIIQADSKVPAISMNARTLTNTIRSEGQAQLAGLIFQSDKPVLALESKFALEEIAQFLQQHSEQAFMLSIGYDVGKNNNKAAHRATTRAEKIRQALVLGWGVPRDQLRVETNAELKPGALILKIR